MWIYLGLLSALFLGFYNICKKISVRGNAVLPVLFFTTLSGLIALSPLYFGLHGNFSMGHTVPLSPLLHGLLAIKSIVLTAAWVLSFYGLKHLPITIASPIRSSSPFFTVIGAVLLYRESPSVYQWLGLVLIVGAMLLYSHLGKLEGIVFKANRWVFAVIAGTFLGACSGLYDKFLVQQCQLAPLVIQFWFTFYMVVLLGVIIFVFFVRQSSYIKGFKWSWAIPAVGVLLAGADYFYFTALQQEGTYIMLLSAIKRSQILITVFVGGAIFKEENKLKKTLPLLGVIFGVGLILYAE